MSLKTNDISTFVKNNTFFEYGGLAWSPVVMTSSYHDNRILKESWLISHELQCWSYWYLSLFYVCFRAPLAVFFATFIEDKSVDATFSVHMLQMNYKLKNRLSFNCYLHLMLCIENC